MKYVISFFISFFFFYQLQSQSPQELSFQAVIRNAENELVSEQQVSLRISILQSTETSSSVYVETQTPTTNANGLISIKIGGEEATVESGSFSGIDWSDGPYFIKTETDPEGGTDYTINGTVQILSVPYALYAERAESLVNPPAETDPLFTAWDRSSGITYSETDPVFEAWDKSTGISISEDQITDRPDYLTEETQDLSEVIAAGNSANGQIKNLTDPTEAQDAVTKSFLENTMQMNVSTEGDTLFTGNGQWLIIPGISAANAGPAEGIVDADGNVYSSVVIGSQEWLGENLRTTKYNDGTEIPLIELNNDWSLRSEPAYCWYNNNPANKEVYGALYNWYVVESEIVCPSDWHVPSDEEWSILISYLGGEDIAGGKLKVEGEIYWSSPNTNATNVSGFAAVGGGYRNYSGSFDNLGIYGHYWTSTAHSYSGAYYRNLHYSYGGIYRIIGDAAHGCSVRCIKD